MGMEWEWNRNIHGNCLTPTMYMYDKMVRKYSIANFYSVRYIAGFFYSWFIDILVIFLRM